MSSNILYRYLCICIRVHLIKRFSAPRLCQPLQRPLLLRRSLVLSLLQLLLLSWIREKVGIAWGCHDLILIGRSLIFIDLSNLENIVAPCALQKMIVSSDEAISPGVGWILLLYEDISLTPSSRGDHFQQSSLISIGCIFGGFLKYGYTIQYWMVDFMENPIKFWWEKEVALFQETSIWNSDHDPLYMAIHRPCSPSLPFFTWEHHKGTSWPQASQISLLAGFACFNPLLGFQTSWLIIYELM